VGGDQPEAQLLNGDTMPQKAGGALPLDCGWTILSLAAVFATVSLALSSPARASAYSFTQIDVPGASSTNAAAINDAGQIVGTFENITGFHAFLDSGGSFSQIDVPGGSYTFASGINNAGQIVGDFDSGGSTHGFLDRSGSFTQIDVPGANYTLASGINGAGQIVGVFQNSTGTHGFLDSNGSFTQLNAPGALAGPGTQASGINGAGQIVGSFSDGSSSRGFLDTGGNFAPIDVPGASSTNAAANNQAGQIVGTFENSTGFHGFVDTGGVFTQIAVPGSSLTQSSGINNMGEIVGGFTDSNGTQGFLAKPNGMGIGDPHLTTFDSRPYNFYASGEFVLTQSTVAGNSFDVQVQTRPWRDASVVSIISALAARVGNDSVTFELERANKGESFVAVDGHPSFFSAATGVITLDAGRIEEISPNDYRVVWDTGETLDVTDAVSHLDLTISLSPKDGPGSVEGLLGTDSGWDSDFQLPNGTVLGPQLSISDIDGEFADAWRVTDASSLFDATDVPEPGTMTLLGIGLTACGIIRHRANNPGQRRFFATRRDWRRSARSTG
jgi:probable HAF family extracellular repeat protein